MTMQESRSVKLRERVDILAAENVREAIAYATGERLTARQRARLGGSLRRLSKRLERERLERVGRVWLAKNAVHAVTAAYHAAEDIGRQYVGSDAAEIASDTIDRLARSTARRAERLAELERLEPKDIAAAAEERDHIRERLALLRSSRGSVSYAAAMARLYATQLARSAVGRGHMPRLVIAPEELERRLIALYGAEAFTLRDNDGPRPLTDAESTLQTRELTRFIRVERTPAYSPFVGALGDTAPSVMVGHAYGAMAPAIPERDAAPLARGTLAERLAAVGVDDMTIRGTLAARDYAATGAKRLPWRDIAAEINAPMVPANLARRVREGLRALENATDAAVARGGDVLPHGTAVPFYAPLTVAEGTGICPISARTSVPEWTAEQRESMARIRLAERSYSRHRVTASESVPIALTGVNGQPIRDTAERREWKASH